MGRSIQCAERVHLNSLLAHALAFLASSYVWMRLTDLLHLRGLVGVKAPPLRIVKQETKGLKD